MRLKSQQPWPGHEEASKILRSVKHSPSLEGFHHLGHDGVLRSFSSRREVVGYKQLNPEQVELMVKSMEAVLDPDSFKTLTQKFRGVDGRNVMDSEQLLHPGPEGRSPSDK